MKKLIIFDLDGTLLDTLDDLKESVNFALSAFSFPSRTREQVRKDIGNGVAKLIERSIPNNAANPHYLKCLSIFKEHYQKHYMDRTIPYDGMKEVLIKLKQKGYLLSVATNKIDHLAKELINKHYPNIFDFVLGDIDGVPKKPNPDMITAILKHFNLDKEDALYIGDTNVDEQTALNSGLDYYLLSYGYRTKEEILNSCISKNILDKPEDILVVL